ncbi:PAS domain S-box-containing protein [Ensifer mexicanus]|nr:PAS domain-containing protein [Sinorhizobium mexicanum]MBP1886065.1 PAS domain S-box-containing protein [Sinorhizobium mexicanum]
MIAMPPQQRVALMLTASIVGIAVSWLTTTPFGLLAPVAALFVYARLRTAPLLLAILGTAFAASILAAFFFSDGMRDVASLWAAFFAVALCIGAIIAAGMSASSGAGVTRAAMRSTPGEGASARANKWIAGVTGASYEEGTAPGGPPSLSIKKAEEALWVRERELSQLIDMTPSHLWRLTPDGEPTFFNKRMVDFLGMDVADTDKLGTSRLEVVIGSVHPDDAAEFRNALNRCLVTGEGFAMRYRLRRADGIYRWMSSRAEPLRDQDGRIVQWYGLCHDIDDQVHAEEALRRSERQLQQLIDAVPALIWCMTPEGIPCYLNKRVTDVTGISLKDLLAPDGSRYLTVVHPDDRDAVDRGLARSFETGAPFVGRYRQRRSNGPHRWVESRAEPLRDECGAIIQWYGVSVDIEDLIRAQEALRERERELSQLVDMVPSLLWRLTADGEPTFSNERMVDFLGMDVADTVKPGKTRLEAVIEAVIHPDERAELRKVLGRCFVTGKGFAMRYRLRRADGVYRWMSGRAEPLRDDRGEIVQWFGLCHDIDDQFRAEEALRRTSDRLAQATRVASLAELSASLAHEMNQPLAAIVASSHACHHWLSAEPPNVERAKVTVERIIRSAGSAADVISRIRALFRPAPQNRSSEDVNHLIGEVCRLMTDEIAAKDVHIQTNLEPNLPSVALDRVQVQQVLVNLIRNAIEAMDAVVDASRALQIRSCRDGLNAIRIEVRDAGTGFKDAERAFEPFFTTKPHGMGMGLSICRSIIDVHGGRLWSADNETHGATVAFTLPLAVAETS